MIRSRLELVQEAMLEYLGHQIHEIVESVLTRRRKLDSAPLP